MKGKSVLHLGRRFLVLGLDEQNIPIHLIEPDANKQSIECGTAYDQRHTCRDGLILDGSEMHLTALPATK